MLESIVPVLVLAALAGIGYACGYFGRIVALLVFLGGALVLAIAGIVFASVLESATLGWVFGLSAMFLPAVAAPMVVGAVVGMIVRNRRARKPDAVDR